MVKVILEFKNSHHYVHNIEKTDLYCPLCGKREIWVELGQGDYYQGSSYYCTSCISHHNLDSSHTEDQEAYINMIKQIKESKAIIPTTPIGG